MYKFFTLRSIPTFPEETIKLWLKDATYIKDYLFRFVNMWIPFPNLPIFFFKTTTIANVVGKVLLIGWSDPHLDPVSQGYALRWIF